MQEIIKIIIVIVTFIIIIIIIYRGHIVVHLGQRLSCAGLKTQDKPMKDLSSLSPEAQHSTNFHYQGLYIFVCCALCTV